MQYRLLGSTGVKVSSLCFGTMSFGAEADAAMAAAMFARCRDIGINFFDCADVYAGGRSEEILGQLIAPNRAELVICSKFAGATGSDPNAGGASRRHVRSAVEASLRRLGTDYLDVYFVHHFDAHTPIEQTLRALEDLVRDGKILYPAASNFAAWQVTKALGVSAQHGWTRFECIQPMYNLVKRQAEVELLPMAQAEQLGVITYSPLGAGLLTGKYTTASRPSSGRIVGSANYRARYAESVYFEVAERFANFASERGIQPASLAVAWVASHPAVTAPIIGARNLEQLEGSLSALKVDMTPELRAEITALSPAPPPATDRTEERASP
jgi:aryl-alcohol dehydrogenase-like predicted oxidoreductase